MKYAKINSQVNGNIRKGVLFATYSALIGESQGGGKYKSRYVYSAPVLSVSEPEPVERQLYAGARDEIFLPAPVPIPAMQIHINVTNKF
jgi:hypothetical protein